MFKVSPIIKCGRGKEKFEISVYTHIYQEPYRTMLFSVVRPGLEASLRSATSYKIV